MFLNLKTLLTKQPLYKKCLERVALGNIEYDTIEHMLIEKLGKKPFLLYGTGGTGYLIYVYFFAKYGIYPSIVFDRHVGVFFDMSINKFPEDIYVVDKEMPVLLAIRRDDVVKRLYHEFFNLGFKNIITLPPGFYDLLLIYNHPFMKDFLVFDYRNFSDQVLHVFEILQDAESKYLLLKLIEMLINCERVEIPHKPLEEQYFPFEIFQKEDYEIFIDCGAYTGDTVEMLVRKVGKIKTLICIEPDKYNSIKSKSLLNSLQGIVADQIIFLPLALSDKEEIISFQSLGGASSKCETDKNFNTYNVYAVPLDDLLLGVNPTMIKMDIEGAEFEALIGANKTIKRAKPSLAISVYHHPTHIFKIPLLIKSIDEKYRIYLRKYGDSLLTEFILYGKIAGRESIET